MVVGTKIDIRLSGVNMLCTVMVGLYLLSILFPFPGHAQTAWTQTVDSLTANDLYICPDGSVIAAGYILNDKSNMDFKTVKITSEGTVQWQNVFHSANEDQITAVTGDPFENIFVAGRMEDSTGTYDVRFLCYNPAGDQIWEFILDQDSIGRFNSEEIIDMQKDNLGNLVFAGWSIGSAAGSYLFAGKLTVTGSLLWLSRINGFDALRGMSTDLEGSVFLLTSDRLIKFNSAGSIAWHLTHGIFPGNSRNTITVDKTGRAVITGQVFPPGSDLDVQVLCFKPDGMPDWSTTVDYNNQNQDAFYLQALDNGKIILAGISYLNLESGFITAVIGPDSLILWSDYQANPFATNAVYNGFTVNITEENNLILSAAGDGFYRYIYTENGQRLKNDSLEMAGSNIMFMAGAGYLPVIGLTVGGYNHMTGQTTVIRYKPLTTYLDRKSESQTAQTIYFQYRNSGIIRFTLDRPRFLDIRLYDILGRELHHLASANFHTGIIEFQLNKYALASGLYFIRINSESITQSARILYLH